jgi:GTP-binding protein EngB required for normal cell division
MSEKKIAIKILRTKFDKISQQNQTTIEEIKYPIRNNQCK